MTGHPVTAPGSIRWSSPCPCGDGDVTWHATPTSLGDTTPQTVTYRLDCPDGCFRVGGLAAVPLGSRMVPERGAE